MRARAWVWRRGDRSSAPSPSLPPSLLSLCCVLSLKTLLYLALSRLRYGGSISTRSLVRRKCTKGSRVSLLLSLSYRPGRKPILPLAFPCLAWLPISSSRPHTRMRNRRMRTRDEDASGARERLSYLPPSLLDERSSSISNGWTPDTFKAKGGRTRRVTTFLFPFRFSAPTYPRQGSCGTCATGRRDSLYSLSRREHRTTKDPKCDTSFFFGLRLPSQRSDSLASYPHLSMAFLLRRRTPEKVVRWPRLEIIKNPRRDGDFPFFSTYAQIFSSSLSSPPKRLKPSTKV